jgi:glycosyltransferase involved in cell wall biosynthesis
MIKNKLTVIIISYNHKHSIAHAIESVLKQKTNFHFIIKIVDDASTDGTASIIQTYKINHQNKIFPIIREKNIGVASSFHQVLCSIDTPYWAFLEGDDYWCDINKLQLQIDALENNPEASMCGHDTLFHFFNSGKRKTYVGEIQERIIKNIYQIEDQLKVHPSSRVYRTLDIYEKIPEKMVFDSACYMLHISKGPLIFINKIMSVYNYTGSGIWSGINNKEKELMALEIADVKHKYFNGEYYDYIYISPLSSFLKNLIGARLGWRIYFFMKTLYLKHYPWHP